MNVKHLLLAFLFLATPAVACDQHTQHTTMTADQCREFSHWASTVAHYRDIGVSPRLPWEARTHGSECEDFKQRSWTYVASVYAHKELDPMAVRDHYFGLCMNTLPGNTLEVLPRMHLIHR